MSFISDYREHHLTVRKQYWPRELVKPYNFKYTKRMRKQRANRGWSARDAWNGGEHIATVSAGILRELTKEKVIVDWDWYFRTNQWDTLGYKDLNEVAQDIENWLDWEEMSYSEPIWSKFKDDFETRRAVENQLYEDYRNAMRFVAENIGGLWW